VDQLRSLKKKGKGGENIYLGTHGRVRVEYLPKKIKSGNPGNERVQVTLTTVALLGWEEGGKENWS